MLTQKQLGGFLHNSQLRRGPHPPGIALTQWIAFCLTEDVIPVMAGNSIETRMEVGPDLHHTLGSDVCRKVSIQRLAQRLGAVMPFEIESNHLARSVNPGIGTPCR
jgi:hypothetical protein